MSYVKIGVAGPVGSGKTALIEALSRKMAKDYSKRYLYKGRRTVSGKEQCSSGRAYHWCGNRRLSSYSDPRRRFHESGSSR